MKLLSSSAVVFAFALVMSVSAQTPNVINYQGKLVSGTNLFNGTVGLSLRICTNAVGGNVLYEDSNAVAVVDGLYSTFIGDNTKSGNLTNALAAPGDKFIEAAINGMKLVPRERLAAAAYAMMAAGGSGNYVQKIGDTMTGALNIQAGISNALVIGSSGSDVMIGHSANADYFSVALGYEATSRYWGVAVGYQAVAVGESANSMIAGVAIGYAANGSVEGVGIGSQADANMSGVALGVHAAATNSGVAIGVWAEGNNGGVAVGDHAWGSDGGVTVGNHSGSLPGGVAVGNSAYAVTNGIAIGLSARANASNAIAIGNGAINVTDESALFRGTLYLDGATGIYYRSTFGGGAWLSALPPTNLYVRKTGDTMTGALTIHSHLVLNYTNSGMWGPRRTLSIVGSPLDNDVQIGTAANGYLLGTALGTAANAIDHGTALGSGSTGVNCGVAVGWNAFAPDYGAAVGHEASAWSNGAALGPGAHGYNHGAAVGDASSAFDNGVAVGYGAVGDMTGIAIGESANGRGLCIAIGLQANSAPAIESIAIGNLSAVGSGVFNATAIGANVTNHISNTTVLRGSLYLDMPGALIWTNDYFCSTNWGVKAFTIDHPLDPQNKVLRHYCLEGPVVQNVYNGIATLDAEGGVVIELPPYFSALNRDPRYILTPIGAAMPGLHVAKEIEVNRFSIGGGAPGGKVSWEIKAARSDPAALADLARRPVEQLKSDLTPNQTAAENRALDATTSNP